MNAISRRPAFSATVVATLALGIAASCVVWTAVRAVLIDLPPVARPAELRVVERTLIGADGLRADGAFLSYPVYLALREQLGAAGRLAAYTAEPRSYVLAAGAADTMRAPVEFVSGDYLDVLGVAMLAGRALGAVDDQAGAAPVVVLGEHAARAAFGDPATAVGATLRIDGHPFTVVGVAPAGFAGLSQRAAGFVPMAQAPTLTFARRLTGTLSFWHQAVLRPATGVGEAELAARFAAAGAAATARFGGDRIVGFEFRAIDLRAARGDRATTRTLWLLSGGVVALLLLACANAANLMLVRGVTRAPELATRIALGADRGRLVRAALAEGLVLALAAAALALPLAAAVLWLLSRSAPGLALGTVPLAALELDLGAAAFAVLTAVLCMGMAASGPASIAARQAERQGVVGALRGPQAGAALRRGLVAAETALATLLLVGAGLMLRSAWNLQQTPLGYEPAPVLVADLGMPSARYRGAEADVFLASLLERVAALPGVERAALAYCPPPTGGCDQIVARLGEVEKPVALNQVSAGYFDALAVPLRAGRGFGAGDGAGAPPVVVLSESAARALFGSTAAALGGRLSLGIGWPEQGAQAEVVGVVGDVLDRGPLAEARALVYVDQRQQSYGESRLVVRGATPALLARPVAAAVRALDPEVLAWDLRPLSERLAAAIAREKLVAALLLGFGAIALALAAVGVAAVIGLAVAQRRREFGIRLAVGAPPAAVLRIVLGDGLAVVATGVAIGALAALAIAPVLGALLHDVAPADPAVLATTALTILVAGGLGAAMPAWRASRTDPSSVLRSE